MSSEKPGIPSSPSSIRFALSVASSTDAHQDGDGDVGSFMRLNIGSSLARQNTQNFTSIRRIFTRLIPGIPEPPSAPRRTNSQRGVVFSAPAFHLRPFNPSPQTWDDPIIVFNNAMRFETRTLFFILYCLQHLPDPDLHAGDIQSFFIWFEDYHNFFCNYVALVNDTLLPALRDLIPFRHVTPRYFGIEGERLNRIVAKTMSSSNRFMHIYDPQSAVVKLLDVYSQFSQPLLWYLFSLEKYSAVVIQRFGSVHEASRISQVLATAIRTMPNFSRTLAILLHWLRPRPQSRFLWLSDHYDYFTVRLFRLWKRPTQHERIVQYFKLKSKPQADS